MFHLYRLGADHGRVFLGCKTKKCRFRKWLDEQKDFKVPSCRCAGSKPMLIRKVMGLRDNGRYFFQCAEKQCKLRIWITTDSDKHAASKYVKPFDEVGRNDMTIATPCTKTSR